MISKLHIIMMADSHSGAIDSKIDLKMHVIATRESTETTDYRPPSGEQKEQHNIP